MKLKELIYATLCGMAVLCTPACQTNELLCMTEEQYLIQENETQRMIESARQGDVDAYRALALRYRDGIGCEPNLINAFLYQGIYCSKTGNTSIENMNIYGEEHPSAVLFELLSGPLSNTEFVNQKLVELEKVLPLEAKTLRVVVESDSKGILPEDMKRLEALETDGSLLSPLVQVVFLEDTGKEEDYVALLERIAEKCPFFHSLLANYYESKYWNTEDGSWAYKAIDCYEEADEHGLLTPRFARQYMNLCLNLQFDGLLTCSDEEIARLERIATVKKPEQPAIDE